MLDRYETWQYWWLIDSEQLLFYTKSCISNPWPRAKVRIWENFRAQSPIMQIFPLLGGQRLPPSRQAQLCLTYKHLYNSIYFLYSKLSKRTIIIFDWKENFLPYIIAPQGIPCSHGSLIKRPLWMGMAQSLGRDEVEANVLGHAVLVKPQDTYH